MKKFITAFSLLLVAFSFASKAQTVAYDANADVRTVGSFTKIKVSSAISLYLSQGSTQAVAVSAGDKEHTAKIKTEVTDGVLKIYVENGAWNGWNWGNKHLKAYVTFTELQMLEASGASEVQLVDPSVSVKDLRLEVSGASSIKGGTIKGADFDVEVSGASDSKVSMSGGTFKVRAAGASDLKGVLTGDKMNFDLSGASTVDVQGTAGAIGIVASGASDFKGYELQTTSCKAEASGASNININVSKDLDARASGASNIHYAGDATISNIDMSGSSTVKKKG
jgi:hypothetical protein